MNRQIEAVMRNTGKRESCRLRRQGLVPAVIYGRGMEPLHVALNKAHVSRLVAPGAPHLHRLAVKDGVFEGVVVLKEVQRDPISRQIIHLDFHHVSMGQRVRVEIPIALHGEAQIEKRGLVLQRQLKEVEVECLPESIPDSLSADVSGLTPGQALLVKDLQAPEGVTIVTPPTEVVAVVLVPRAAEEVVEPAAEAAAQTPEKPAAGPAAAPKADKV